MRIAVSGPQCSGKSTLIKDFLREWKMYTTPKKTYRNLVKSKKLKINQKGDKDSQMAILNFQIDSAQKYSKEDNVIFDRCVLDPMVYALWMYEKGIGDLTDDDIYQMLRLTKESLKLYDIIFMTPITAFSPVELVADENKLRDTDETFREEINNIFNAVLQSYHKQTGVIFPLEDCPALIEIFGNPEERIQMIKMYLTPEGKPYGETDNLVSEALIGTP